MFIQNIIYINLDRREDRRQLIENEIAQLKRDSIYTFYAERFPAISHDEGIIGCCMSHIRVVEIAKERKYPYIWIMEDDFTFTESIDRVIELLENVERHILQNGYIFDVLFLAYNIFHAMAYKISDNRRIEHVVQTRDCQTASSYIISEHYYDIFIEHMKEGLHKLIQTGEHWNYANDQYWKELQKRDIWLCIVPRIGKQRPSYSDNSQCFMDYDC